MVRFAPPIVRLVALALNARVQEHAVTPATVGVSVAFGNLRSIGYPIAEPRTPTGYRDSHREAAPGGFPPKQAPPEERRWEDPPVNASKALSMLKAGNERFSSGNTGGVTARCNRPVASILGCTDSLVKIEDVFDAQPGDLFILRMSGLTFSDDDDDLLSVLEDSISTLGVKLLLVFGHTDCVALLRASQRMLWEQAEVGKGNLIAGKRWVLLWASLQSVVEQAQQELNGSKAAREIAARAVKVNVFAQMERLLSQSSTIRRMVDSGEVEIHGAVVDLTTARVEFLGQPPGHNLTRDAARAEA